ncbi:dienelactone hydrolase family protein [Streptomyces albireticuli]|uniref:Dienelactone hydrolase n=1 Tax=Streptomyces albireticuli TaxID=1940 RepID=A0A2A2D765_9ACTN|nr:dienelactone hydrolase family protein [Streptomyces albireticuli]MCD9142752.1 dienelactone hydrolase family protein [Streptomyces albireticuli]MCD9162929.1 dienelactone hydrolase family protein [Streptomyces albireticuli]MCD9192489.1 dienelactone hydrolase family protein [Streptomyces albireticuli]PAU47355.1 dienelactone hydrolase [Streptomyces albireticuli]
MPTRTVEISTPDGTADAFAAFPDDGERHPGVLLYVDAIGLRPVIHEMARKLADQGYYVLAPNIFYRRGPAPVIDVPDLSTAEARDTFFARIMPLLDELTVERAVRDAGAYLDFLTTQPEVRPGPVGTVGYCMGAVLALRAAAARPGQVAAAACFHPGPLVTDTPDSPHLLAPRLNAELLFGLAEHDDSMPPEAVARLNKTLDADGVRYASEVYPDTVHGFTMADTSAFSPSGLQRHWDRLLPFFAGALSAA